MEMTLYITFVLASIVLIVVPGPNVLVVISTSVTHGTARGLQTVLGTSSAMMIQLSVAALGTTWIVKSLAHGFEWLRWAGVGYLLILGIKHLRQMHTRPDEKARAMSASGSYWRGFFVSLTNPKTILFFSAFLPQFVSEGALYQQQIMVLSATFLVLAATLDSLYAILAGRISMHFKERDWYRFQNGVSGTLFIGAGVWLALLRRN